MKDCSIDEWLQQETLCRRQWTDEYVERPEMLMKQNLVVVWLECLLVDTVRHIGTLAPGHVDICTPKSDLKVSTHFQTQVGLTVDTAGKRHKPVSLSWLLQRKREIGMLRSQQAANTQRIKTVISITVTLRYCTGCRNKMLYTRLGRFLQTTK